MSSAEIIFLQTITILYLHEKQQDYILAGNHEIIFSQAITRLYFHEK
jgi:hypothetical protein